MDLNGTLSGRDFVALEQRLFGNNSFHCHIRCSVRCGLSGELHHSLHPAEQKDPAEPPEHRALPPGQPRRLRPAHPGPLHAYRALQLHLVHHPWVFGDAVCRGYYFLRNSCSYATALNIASLSVERYMAICHPFKAKSIMSRSRTKKLISAMWLASFALATPMIFVMGQVMRKGENICTSIVSPVTIKTVLQ
ncbi:hypothetical protein KUCAC02_012173, partial [Chaenocephalus aceratus]